MLNEKINELISSSMKNGEHEKLDVLRLIKNEFMKFKTAKAGNTLDEKTEASILNKMIIQREDSVKQYNAANRPELAEKEMVEINIIKEFAPKQASDEEVEILTKEVIKSYLVDKSEGFKLSMKDMKPIMMKVQETYSTANGKIISKVMNSFINS